MSLKWKIHIKADTDEETKEILRDYAYVLTGLRESRKKWEGSNYDINLRYEMEKWEKRADDLIKKHKVYHT